MKAEVVYLYAYDLGGELHVERITELRGKRLAPLRVEPYKRSPPGFFFYRPQTFAIDPFTADTPHGPVTVNVFVRLAGVGAMSIMVRVPVEFTMLEDLLIYHELRFNARSLDAEVQSLAARVFETIKPHIDKPVERLAEPEQYTVFCLSPPSAERGVVAKWFETERRRIAALLAQERDPTRLSDHEVRESTQVHFSYYHDDLVVVDWDAALVVDDPRAYDELLYVFELANLQQEELIEYDRILDDALDRAYDDLSARGPGAARGRAEIQRELREIRVDLAKVNEELTNTTKFFGDWHVARIYDGVARRFHLEDWAASVSNKLRTLEGLYTLLHQERNNRWMLVLEATIVALFLADLAMLVLRH